MDELLFCEFDLELDLSLRPEPLFEDSLLVLESDNDLTSILRFILFTLNPFLFDCFWFV